MAGELILNEVATPPAPISGKDSVYMSNETLARLRRVDSGGNIWPVRDVLLQCLSGNYTLLNSTAVQAAFNGTANGAITLPASSSYLLQANYLLTNTGTTSHTWAVLFGGTATLTSGQATVVAVSSTSSAVAAANIGYTTTLGSALTVTAASVSATENVSIFLSGVVRINGAGTFIPQIQLSAAPGGTQTMLANSYIELTPFGANTAVSLGNWS